MLNTLNNFISLIFRGIRFIPSMLMEILQAFFISFKNGFKKIIEYWLIWLNFKKEFKLRLISKICVVFVCMLGTLVYIIHMQHNLEPILIDIETPFLNKLVNSKLFINCTHLLFGRLNLGPSYETLLGLIIITFFLLIFLIILSSYMYFFIIILGGFLTLLSYPSYQLIKRHFVIENIDEFSDKLEIMASFFGIKIKRILPELSLTEINNLINFEYLNFLNLYKNDYRINYIQNLNLEVLKSMCQSQQFKQNSELKLYINDYINCYIDYLPKETVKLEPKGITSEGFTIGATIPFDGSYQILGCIAVVVVFMLSMGYLYYRIDLLNEVAKKQQTVLETLGEKEKVLDALKTNADEVDNLRSTLQTQVQTSVSKAIKENGELATMTKTIIENQGNFTNSILKVNNSISSLSAITQNDIGQLNMSVTNLNSSITNLGTSVTDLGTNVTGLDKSVTDLGEHVDVEVSKFSTNLNVLKDLCIENSTVLKELREAGLSKNLILEVINWIRNKK